MDLSRLYPLIKEEEIQKLKETKIALFGLGGVGGYALEALARSGIGTLYLIDGDVIEPSNINRQLLALNSTIGMPKTEIAKERVKDINSLCNVKTLQEMVKPNFEGRLSLNFLNEIDAIVDATDDISLKVALAKEAEERNILIVSSGGTGNRLNAFNFEITDIYKTKNCPLCRTLRGRLKRLNVKSLPILYAKDAPICKGNVVSSVSWCPSVAGLLIAGYIIQRILNLKNS
ncbi:MAG: tRNA threonylcarbamoyladenosine dehydratase [Treponema sp.]